MNIKKFLQWSLVLGALLAFKQLEGSPAPQATSTEPPAYHAHQQVIGR